MQNMNAKLSFKHLKEMWDFKKKLFCLKKLLYAIKCNFTDFDTFSSVQINCSNTHRIGLPFGFATIDWLKRILCKTL